MSSSSSFSESYWRPPETYESLGREPVTERCSNSMVERALTASNAA
jgi:hypothetical protein